ncbi:hypothetical protein INR49_023281, partial [Caranx melampygus]
MVSYCCFAEGLIISAVVKLLPSCLPAHSGRARVRALFIFEHRDKMTDTSESKINMEDFFKTVGEVKSLIENISCQAKEVESKHVAILSSPVHDKRDKDKLGLLNDEIKRNASLVQAKLKCEWRCFWVGVALNATFHLQMDRNRGLLHSPLLLVVSVAKQQNTMQKHLPAEKAGESPSVIKRIVKNQHSHLSQWFAEVMRGYHEAQMSFREKSKSQLRRQLKIVGKVITEEELEVMLHSDNPAIFRSDINSNAQISSKALSEIESRYQDILCLESSIKEMHEIISYTATLIEIQGDLINNIEKNVTSAAEYVFVSNTETKKAVTYKKNSYKIASMPSFFKHFKRQTAAKKRVYFLALPWAATASMAFFTVSASPRKAMGLVGFRCSSSSYTIGIPVGRFSSMMAASDIPRET